MNVESKAIVIRQFLNALLTLKSEGILLNKKDFTCQIGEWLIEVIYGGLRAKSGIQKGWDIEAHGKYIQVKTHSKAEGNPNRWTAIDKDFNERIDELIIIVFTHDYKLSEFYSVPWTVALQHIKLRGKVKPRNEINWSSISDFKIPIEKLPRQDIISIFT